MDDPVDVSSGLCTGAVWRRETHQLKGQPPFPVTPMVLRLRPQRSIRSQAFITSARRRSVRVSGHATVSDFLRIRRSRTRLVSSLHPDVRRQRECPEKSDPMFEATGRAPPFQDRQQWSRNAHEKNASWSTQTVVPTRLIMRMAPRSSIFPAWLLRVAFLLMMTQKSGLRSGNW